MRLEAIALGRWALWMKFQLADAAEWIGMGEKTLLKWMGDWKPEKNRILPAKPLGRKADPSAKEKRDLAMKLITLFGIWEITLRDLQKQFPEMAQRELQDLLHWCREQALKGKTMMVHTLNWTRANRVWAMDFTHPPRPVDGIYGRIFMVRDLASGFQLASVPCEGESAEVAIGVLRGLFLQHGSPLVIKSDNGSAFISLEMQILLQAWRIMPLVSPPCTPWYNGACEAGLGGVNTRAHHESTRQGRPGFWTCSDVEFAREHGNNHTYPRGKSSPTPGEIWADVHPAGEEARQRFLDAVSAEREIYKTEEWLFHDLELEGAEARAMDRAAVVRALVNLGYLEFRRRRIPLRVPKSKRRYIS